MRYVIAMIFAILVAVFVTAQFAAPMTTAILDGLKFESPDQVELYNNLILGGVALLGLIAGWIIGWLVGGLFVRSTGPQAQAADEQKNS